jgi:hypothetical protein
MPPSRLLTPPSPLAPSHPTVEIPTPVAGAYPPTDGLTFPADGSGLTFDAGYPLTFAPDQPGDLSALFPAVIPQVEQIVYERVRDACSSRAVFPADGSGLTFPVSFNVAPDVSLYPGQDGTYTVPGAVNEGKPVPAIPVVRGWPAYPGAIPAIGVAESDSSDDQAQSLLAGGFAGDVNAYDALGNVLATCAYYAEPIRVTVVVELIHVNRDERDRLHDQLRKVIFPLRHLIANSTAQVRDVQVSAEKQDLPLDEQPLVMYISLWTIQVQAEALIPDEIMPVGVISRVETTVTPTVIPIVPEAPDYD